VIDFYLDDTREKERAQILQLVKKTDPASVEFLHGYIREGMRRFLLWT
jgi:linoleate 10R-lipoxygenase